MRVLVIEDDAELAETIAIGLRRARMAVDVAGDGASGLSRATEVPCGSLAHPPTPGTAVFKSVSARDGATPVARCYVLKPSSRSSTP